MANNRDIRGQIHGKQDLVRYKATFEINDFQISGVDCISHFLTKVSRHPAKRKIQFISVSELVIVTQKNFGFQKKKNIATLLPLVKGAPEESCELTTGVKWW